MAITIKGIRLDDITVNQKEGDIKLSANYSLLSSADKVLATQAIGGYNGLAFTPSATTLGKLQEFIEAYKVDINQVLGL